MANQSDYDQETDSSTDRQPLSVEYRFNAYGSSATSLPTEKELFTIEMKMGADRLYVVKNIKELLENISDGRSMNFGKNFTYDPLEHMFIPEDWEIIKILCGIYQSEKLYLNSVSSYFWQQPAQKGKELTISPSAADELIMKLKDRDCRFQHGSTVYPQLRVKEDELPFSFTLEKGGQDEFRLGFGKFLYATYFKKYGWLGYKGEFFKLSPSQQSLAKQLTRFMDGSQGQFLPISKHQIGTFLSHSLPALKKIGRFSISENVSDQIISPPLRPKIFVDGDAERLEVKVEYHYGEFILNPFDHDEGNSAENGMILMRNAEKEREVMAAIENAPLKFNGKQLYLEGEEELFEFLYGTLPILDEKADIYLTNSIKSLILPSQPRATISIDIDSSGDLLNISFDMEEIDHNDVQHILQSLVEKKKYVRLPGGAFLSLDKDELKSIADFINEFNINPFELKNGNMNLPIYRGLQVDQLMSGMNKQSAKFGKSFRRFLKSIKNPDETEYTVPETLQASLRDYQTTGFQWLKSLAHYRLGGILADDMGLGKTLQSIVFILSEKKEAQKHKPVLVVSPASLVYNWKSELSKFAPELEVDVVHGTQKERAELLESTSLPDVLITSYPTLRQDIDWYSKVEFSSMILDEAQAIKNHAAKTSQAVRKIKADKRFALSGTPIENSLDELWSIFDTILPGFFKNQKTFRSLEPEDISRLVRPFILRRVKKDVLIELPDKIETVHLSELTKTQKELYVAYLDKIRQETKDSLQAEGFQKGRIKILAGLTRLRQLCCHPSLFLENYQGHSGKLEQLMELIQNAVENGKRILIFSQFASMLRLIRESLDEEGVSTFYLDGQTPSKERIQMVDAFNQGEKSIFLISLKAGGTGLNLTGADTVILYDLWWNPAIEEQAAGRAHRIGQKNVVQVMRLIARGTIEEKIYELQQKKKELIEKVIQPGETMLTSLSEDEIREILSI